LLTKTLIIEEIFALNGVGTIVFSGLSMGDIPLIMGFSMLVAVTVVFCAIGEDIIYALSDPRIRLGKGAIGNE
jgi:peptide/nickel transport system permease protein